MAIIHIILFQFKDTASAKEIQDAVNRMLALQTTCLHPTTNKPYVNAIIGGKDISSEGRQNGITHAFIAEFENAVDRQYYMGTDPAHKEFVESAKSVLEKVQVVDFVPGMF
ncbi:hypothetical protein MMC31_002145 [Peltigera leucophlebia]|nr:hypothetical protein [Peltigera leucophlebia]